MCFWMLRNEARQKILIRWAGFFVKGVGKNYFYKLIHIQPIMKQTRPPCKAKGIFNDTKVSLGMGIEFSVLIELIDWVLFVGKGWESVQKAKLFFFANAQ